MNIVLFIAKRYLFSKKSSNAVNIISWISVFSIAVATFALVTVLSAFNGLQSLVESLYEEFEPDLKITAVKGKWIDQESIDLTNVKKLKGVEAVHQVVEELTLVRYGKQQSPCTIKGVTKEFISTSGIESKIYNGTAGLEMNHQATAIIGYGLASVLSVYINNNFENLKFYAPKLSGNQILAPSDAFYTKSITPTGIFMINPDIDNKFVIVPLEFAQDLLNKKNKITAIEIKVEDGFENSVKADLINWLGHDYKIESRFELNQLIYQTNQSEKVVTFFILLFILVIATFNVVSTVTMILLEKEKHIKTMRILGFNYGAIRRIFIAEGMFINLIGISIGMLSGLILCLLQINYGLVRLEGGIVDFYPVKLLFNDFAIIFFTSLSIGFLASYFPSRIFVKANSYATNSAVE